jgi:DNA topoisomerase-3
LKSSYNPVSLCDPALISSNNKHIFNSTQLEDHHALIPLAVIPEAASEKERKVYAIVLESFFTVCMPDFIYNEKSLRFHIGEYVFTAKIREVLQKGWKEAIKEEVEQAEDVEQEITSFDEQHCSVTAVTVREKKTEPKKELAIDTLLAFMEHPKGETESGETKLAGLGTPATRADIIQKLFVREYVTEEKRKLYASGRGRFLLEQLARNEHLQKLADVSNTTSWEQRLTDDPETFVCDIQGFVTQCVKAGSGRAVYQQEPLGKCPLCGKPVVETKMAYGCSGYKDEPKCSFAIWKTIAGAAVSTVEASLLLTGQKTKLKKCKNKEGKAFEASFVLEGGKVVFQFKK